MRNKQKKQHGKQISPFEARLQSRCDCSPFLSTCLTNFDLHTLHTPKPTICFENQSTHLQHRRKLQRTVGKNNSSGSATAWVPLPPKNFLLPLMFPFKSYELRDLKS